MRAVFRSIYLLGTDVTIVTFSRQVGVCLKAAEALQQEGINAEVFYVIWLNLQCVGYQLENNQTNGRCYYYYFGSKDPQMRNC